MVDAIGQVFGDETFYCSLGNIRLDRPIEALTGRPTGHGYWMVADDGGIFTYADARFYGSTGNIRLAQPIVGMAATPTGTGYWIVATDGGIFTFGDAPLSARPEGPAEAQRWIGDQTDFWSRRADAPERRVARRSRGS